MTVPVRAPDTLAVAFPSHVPRRLTSAVELSLAQTVWSGLARPLKVGRVIELMFDQVSGHPVSAGRVRLLASSAREWLLQRAALRVWQDRGWYQARCGGCAREFDIPVSLNAAPRKSAAQDFPVIEVPTSLGLRLFEAPNGRHEELLVGETEAPVRRLLALVGLADSAEADARAFTKEDVARIEMAFEEACPEIADTVESTCPNCALPVAARIDPLDFAFPRPAALLRDVHVIAAAYHWSEDQILALPASRRAAYAGMIREGRR